MHFLKISIVANHVFGLLDTGIVNSLYYVVHLVVKPQQLLLMLAITHLV